MGYDGNLKFDTSVDVKGFTSGVSSLKGLATSAASTITSVFTTAVTAVTTGLIAAGTAATNVGMEFEASMSKVSAISGATGDDLQALTEKAKEMGATTQFSASEAAQAFQYMAMAGWDTQSMLDGIDGIMNLSAADGLDLATTSDIVTDALTAFGLSASDSTHFADVLATASSSANTNVSMLGESFKYVAPLAGAMNYSVEDVSLALGLMANASVKGSMAGTSLKTSLARLASPTKDMVGTMIRLGISITANNGKALGLRDIIVQLRDKFSDLSETEQAAAASTLFGKDAMSGMLAIINASEDDFNKLANSIDKADGTAQSMAKTMIDNLKGKITIMKSALEGLGITVYNKLEKGLKEAVEVGTDYIDRLSKAFTDGGLESAIGEAGKIFGELATKIAGYAPDMLKAAVGFIKAFVQGIIDNKDEVLNAAKEIVQTIGETLLDLLPNTIKKPVVDMVQNLQGALGAVVEAFTDAFDSEDIGNAITGIVDFISMLVEVVTDFVKSVAPAFSKALQTIKSIFTNNNFKNGISKIKDSIKILGTTASNAVKIGLTVLSNILKFVGEHLNTILTFATPVLTAIAAFEIAKKASVWVGALSTALESAKTGASGLFAVLEANPFVAVATAIGTVVTALAVLIAYTDSGYYQAERIREGWETTNKALEAASEKCSDLGTALNMDDAFDNFTTKMQEARGSMDGIAESTIYSTEEMQNLETEMENVQQKITNIAGTYSKQRKELTSEEIEELKSLFEEMRNIAENELALMQGYQNAAYYQTEQFVANFDGSLTEFSEQAAEYMGKAADARQSIVDKANEVFENEIAAIGQMAISESERKKLEDEAWADYKEAVNTANEAYTKNIELITRYTEQNNDTASEFGALLIEMREQYNNIYQDFTTATRNAQGDAEKLQKAADDFAKRETAWADKYSAALEQMDNDETAAYLSMLKTAQDKGVEISDESALLVAEIANALKGLPAETRESMGDFCNVIEEIMGDMDESTSNQMRRTIENWLCEIRENGTNAERVSSELAKKVGDGISSQELFIQSSAQKASNAVTNVFENTKSTTYEQGKAIGNNIAQGAINGINENSNRLIFTGENLVNNFFDSIKSTAKIASPSKVMKKLFGYIVEGGVVGIEDNQAKLFKSAEDLALGTMESISDNMNADILTARVAFDADTNGFLSSVKNSVENSQMLARLKAAVASEVYSIGSSVATRTSIGTSGYTGGAVKASGNIHTVLNIDGRELAVAIAPFIDEELGFA